MGNTYQIIMDSTKYKKVSPKGLQEDFFKLLQTRFPHTEISKGELAVTVKFSDYEIQLLPALRENGRIRIANRETKGWSPPINVSAFTRKLTNYCFSCFVRYNIFRFPRIL